MSACDIALVLGIVAFIGSLVSTAGLLWLRRDAAAERRKREAMSQGISAALSGGRPTILPPDPKPGPPEPPDHSRPRRH